MKHLIRHLSNTTTIYNDHLITYNTQCRDDVNICSLQEDCHICQHAANQNQIVDAGWWHLNNSRRWNMFRVLVYIYSELEETIRAFQWIIPKLSNVPRTNNKGDADIQNLMNSDILYDIHQVKRFIQHPLISIINDDNIAQRSKHNIQYEPTTGHTSYPTPKKMSWWPGHFEIFSWPATFFSLQGLSTVY